MSRESCSFDLLSRYAEKIIESGQLGKSELYPKLLHYLVEASRCGNAPKEMDIALDVFGKDESFNVHEDSIVRVYAHSLRAKLDEYYRGPGDKDEIRIEIPKGAYRVVATPQAQPESVSPPAPVNPSPSPPIWARRSVVGFVGAVLAASALGNIYFVARDDDRQGPAEAIGKTFVWADFLKDRRPVTIVLGDIFFYTSYDQDLGRERFIGDVQIRSREDLRVFLKDHPDRASKLGALETTLLTKGTAYGLTTIMPILDDRGRDVKVTILDELDVDDIRKNDVIFIGPLRRLGPLAMYFDTLSQFDYEPDKNTLKDRKTGKELAARMPLSQDGLDYGLFTKFRGPAGNHIMIFGSVASDIGLLQIVHSMTSPSEIKRIQALLEHKGERAPTAFEALFSATGYDRTDLGANMIDVHALEQPTMDDGSGRL